MIIAGNELPDRCPENCPHRDSFALYGQNSICGRCPVFCCIPCDDDGFCLVEPADYRSDWAKEWAEWFKNGMENAPELLLQFKEDKE